MQETISTQDKRLRHPTNGGYARGEETRLRIIEAAISVFGERGYKAATTREIAQRAGVNPPALQYYFENKEGVFGACAEHMACTSRDAFSPVISQVEAALAGGAQGRDAIDLFCLLLEAIVDHLIGMEDFHHRHLFMARAQNGDAPDGGIAALREKITHPINVCGASVLSRLSGQAPDSPMLKMKALMLFGPVLVFHIGRPMALHVMGWDRFTPERIVAVKAMLREQTTQTLRSWLDDLSGPVSGGVR